ncbi:hypothetical protein [Micromonospora humi]|uniref:hypothetical protein n=1 Tax=Micromonospora humi TaxID=745366 RepID=UPI001FE0F894|nr:hypothetical protein [Micromonospora humi]
MEHGGGQHHVWGFTASTRRATSLTLAGRYGTSYRQARPVAASDVAWCKVSIPETWTSGATAEPGAR